ncbi:hypothetical protein [Dactylosporangium sp. NPDC006015]|uniref:hypothetical protein n=1 Tax=Dactylosporangium sp. NPDC006015 TaxID=3154576 RepID=UPI0033B2CAA5
MGSPAYEPFRRMRASAAYRVFITGIEVLLVVVAVRGLVWLLDVLHAPQAVIVPLDVASTVVWFPAVLTTAVSMVVLVGIGRRWGSPSGISISGQLEFTLMVLDDLRHPFSWPSRPYIRW